MPVNLRQATRDLQEIGKTVAANPTVGKQILHSGAFSPLRRAVQSKGAFGSAVAKGAKKIVSLGLNQIPYPAVGSIVDGIFGKVCEEITHKLHERKINHDPSPEERVKFQLKEIGGQVEDWDLYRWKVAHAADQYNKVVKEVQEGISTAPCDTWVRVWAKFYYLGGRIAKLRTSVAAMRAILDKVDEWLNTVEGNYVSAQMNLQGVYDKDVAQLKSMQVHDTCSDTKCMFKQGQWTSKMNVPTSDPAKFLIRAASKAIDFAASADPASIAIEGATFTKAA